MRSKKSQGRSGRVGFMMCPTASPRKDRLHCIRVNAWLKESTMNCILHSPVPCHQIRTQVCIIMPLLLEASSQPLGAYTTQITKRQYDMRCPRYAMTDSSDLVVHCTALQSSLNRYLVLSMQSVAAI